jgi:hypothetical protein
MVSSGWPWRETRFAIALDDDASWLQWMYLFSAKSLELYLSTPDVLLSASSISTLACSVC